MGKTVRLDGRPRTVVGVLPPRLRLPTLAPADVLVPLALDEAEQRTRRTAILLWSVGRLKPGVTLCRGRGRLAAALPGRAALRFAGVPQRRASSACGRSATGRSRTPGWPPGSCWRRWRPCFSSRAATSPTCCWRAPPRGSGNSAFARRWAPAAAAWPRQALTESLLLAVTGGAAGCALAFLLLRLFLAIAPEGILRLHQAVVDGRVLLFSVALAVVSGVLFGLAPALENPRLASLAGTRIAGASRHRFRARPGSRPDLRCR